MLQNFWKTILPIASPIILIPHFVSKSMFNTIPLLHCSILVCTKLWTYGLKLKVLPVFLIKRMLHHFCEQRENDSKIFRSQNVFEIKIFKRF